MIDQTTINRAKSVNLKDLIAKDTDLRRVALCGNGEFAGACPFCGGKDRFRVQPDHPEHGRWLCRGCTDGKWQDTIAYVMRRESISFAEACKRLAGTDNPNVFPPQKPDYLQIRSEKSTCKKQIPQNTNWQIRAQDFIEQCQRMLWSDKGARARNWLFERGLQEDTLRQWRIGFNPDENFESLASWGFSRQNCDSGKKVWLPRGIIIPCLIDDQVWYVKIRRADQEPKYVQIKGGTTALFGAQNLAEKQIGVFCEGEFESILLHQEAGDLAGIATLGSAQYTHLDLETWGRYLLPLRRILIAFDNDDAGILGGQNMATISPRIQRIRIPCIHESNKDLTDFYMAGGNLHDWLKFELARQENLASAKKGLEAIENPEIAFKAAHGEIIAMIQNSERNSKRTWGEILLTVQKQTPELARAYYRAFDKVNCDIYGQWLDGSIQLNYQEDFRLALKDWQQAVRCILDYDTD